MVGLCLSKDQTTILALRAKNLNKGPMNTDKLRKSRPNNFLNSRLFTREAGGVRWGVLYELFEQSTSNHFSVHVGIVKWEVGSGKLYP